MEPLVSEGSRSWRQATLSLVGGCCLGCANSLSSALGSPYGAVALAPEGGVRWLEYVAAWLGTPWAWGLFAFGVGWLIRRRWAGAAMATGGLLVAVAAYYGCDALLNVNDSLSTGEILYWTGVSLVVGPTMAEVGRVAREGGKRGLIAAMVAPGLMVASTALFPVGSDNLQPWVGRSIYLAATGLALCTLLRCRRNRLPPVRLPDTS